MPTTSEAALVALSSALSDIEGLAVERNSVLPERVSGGLLILRDGEPGEPEVSLSPRRYHYEHLAEAEIFVQGASNDTAFDAVKASIGAALEADRTLGGNCDWAEAEAPSTENVPVLGATSIKAAIIPIRLIYSTSDPLA
jgi:hypothetical protein